MNVIAQYKQAEEYILSIPKFTKKNTWEQTREFYEFLGKPGKGSKMIHVAGTNGKGSVCAYMESCLRESGYSVGMFTSPHLVTMRERIRVGGKLILPEEFTRIFQDLQSRVEDYNEKKQKSVRNPESIMEFGSISQQDLYHPTFFEWLFFLAMLYFEDRKPEVILLETGLGGRLDATNVIDPPAVCVLTQIGLDHMEYLGKTTREIAGEKAGIIKPGSFVVYGDMGKEIEAVISRKIEECGCLFRKVVKQEDGFCDLQDKRIDFSFYSRYYDYIPLSINSIALYQQENVTLALSALEEAGFILSPGQLQRGVMNGKWEGRMEEVRPGVFLDGAHNRDGMKALLKTVRHDGCRKKRWLLFSQVADKEYEIMKEQILSENLFHKICVAPMQNERSLNKDELNRLFPERMVHMFDTIAEGLDKILAVKDDEDIVYVAGSLYLVGEAKEYFSGSGE